MPRKIKQLIRDLEKAGFVNRGGKGSHRNFVHPDLAVPISISGKLNEDAKQYQEKAIRSVLEELNK